MASTTTTVPWLLPAAVVSRPSPAERAWWAFLLVLVLSPLPSLVATGRQYTLSLLMFVAPVGALSVALVRRRAWKDSWRPLALSLGVLFPMGAVLNLLFADDFFTYPNAAATLGWAVPAVRGLRLSSSHPIPVEEFAFYGFGFAAILLAYVWVGEVWLPARAPRVDWSAARAFAALVPVVLALLAYQAQRHLAPERAFPAYLTYLLLVPLPVALWLWPCVRSAVNWPALALVTAALLALSVVWEVSLAIPQGWWGYNADAMVGLHLRAWHGLPVEAVLVWVLTPITTIFVFEAARGVVAGRRAS